MSTTKKTQPGQAHRRARAARLALVQALFQIDANQSAPDVVRHEFVTHRLSCREDYPDAPLETLFLAVFDTIEADKDAVDVLLQDLLPTDSLLARHEPVLRAVLRAGAWELLTAHPFAPAPVVISEYVNIARDFCGPKQASFTNGILDGLARKLQKPLKKD